jgi:hypothetical protein
MRRNLYLAAVGLAAITASAAANAATCASSILGFGLASPGPTLAPVDCTFSESGGLINQAFFEVSGPSSLTVSNLTYSGTLDNFDSVGLFSPNDSSLANLLAHATNPTTSFTYATLTPGTIYDLVVAEIPGNTVAGEFAITAVPLPASAWLLLGALGGMGLLARRRTA